MSMEKLDHLIFIQDYQDPTQILILSWGCISDYFIYTPQYSSIIVQLY